MKAAAPRRPSPAAPSATSAGADGGDVVPPARRGTDLAYLRRLWPYLSRQRAAFVTALVLYPLNAACVVLPPYFMQQMFDRGLRQNNLAVLWAFAGAYAGATVADYVTGFLAEYLTSRVGQRAMAALRHDLFAHVQKLPASYFSHVPVGRLLTRMTSDVEALGEMFTTGAVTMLSDMLSVLAVVSMMLYLSPKLTLASFCIVPLLVATAVGFQGYARRAFQEIRRQLARINAFVAEHVGAMDVVQAFGQQARTQREFAEHNEAYRVANHRAIFADAALFAI
ncbi:MAG: ABC transporter ATP-binding protein, partial [Caulobacteraceae bacterium]|nr:ABC transporter ATP-binding protein [Caulobacter sp.]